MNIILLFMRKAQHFKDNNYNKILIDSKNKISLEYKINEIIDRIIFEKFFSSSVNYLYAYKCSKIKLRSIINYSLNSV